MPKVTAIHHVAVQTRDLANAIQFYVKILGAELLERRPFKKREMAWLKVGDTLIELLSRRAGENLETWSDLYSGPVHISFVVKDLCAFVTCATGKGARLHPSHPQIFVPPVVGAGPVAYLIGPDGEEVELREAS